MKGGKGGGGGGGGGGGPHPPPPPPPPPPGGGGGGAPLLPLMPFEHEITTGLLHATKVSSPPLTRTLALCASGHIPGSAASKAVEGVTLALVRELCRTGHWQGASLLR